MASQPGGLLAFLTHVLDKIDAGNDAQLALSESLSLVSSPSAMPSGAQVRSEWKISLDWPARTWFAQPQTSLQGPNNLM